MSTPVKISKSGIANPGTSNGDEPSTSENGHDFQVASRNSDVFERDLISSLPVVDLTKESVADLTKACDRSELTTIHNFDGASSISLRRVYEYNHASTDPADWTRISEPGEEPELFVKAPPAPIIGAL